MSRNSKEKDIQEQKTEVGGGSATESQSGTLNVMLDMSPNPAEAGQAITGTVYLKCQDSSVNIQNVYMLLYGEARTYLGQKKGGWGGREVQAEDREVFLREFVTLWDQITLDVNEMEDNQKTQMSLTFNYVLPRFLPSTYLGEIGSIRYFGQATVVVSGQNTKVYRRFFTVRSRQNPDYFPQSFEKQLRFPPVGCCMKNDIITSGFNVSQSAYNAGEPILISGFMENRSKRRTIGGLKIHFIQVASCTAEAYAGHTESKAKETVLGRLFDGRIIPGKQSLEWRNGKIWIPKKSHLRFLEELAD